MSDKQPATQRALILSRVRDRIEALFGAQGSQAQLFREVWRRPWQPGNPNRPAVTVSDNGVERSDGCSDETKKRVGKFHVVVDLVADGSRQGQMEDWSDRIEALALAIQNFNPQCGVMRMDYLSDDPFTVEIPNGPSEKIWTIMFEYEYVVGVTAFADKTGSKT